MDTELRGLMRTGLKVIGRKEAQSRMMPDGIIEPFDVFEDVPAGLCAGCILLVMNPLVFESAKKTFHDGVVVAVAFAAHADQDPVGFQNGLDLVAGILAATIRVVEQLRPGLALIESHAHACLPDRL